MKKRALLYRFFGLLALVLALLNQASCATTSARAPSIQELPFSELPAGADLYFFADIQKSQSLITGLYQAGSIPSLQKISYENLKYMGQAYGALYNELSSQRFYVLVTGQFPVFKTNLSLFFSPDWKRKTIRGLSYWRSEKDGLSLRISPRGIAVSDGVFLSSVSENVVSEEVGSPRYSAEAVCGSNLYLVHNAPQSLFQSFLGSIGFLGQGFNIPLAQISIKLYPADHPGLYQLQGSLVTTSPSFGKALGALFSVASRIVQPFDQFDDMAGPEQVLPQIGSLLLSERPVVEGSSVYLTSKTITEAELTLLLHRLLVYFERKKFFKLNMER